MLVKKSELNPQNFATSRISSSRMLGYEARIRKFWEILF
jgi:hypothetical protein